MMSSRPEAVGSEPPARDSAVEPSSAELGTRSQTDVAPELRNAETLIFVDDLESPVVADDDSHHLSAVLRLRPGAVVAASDGRGAWSTYRYAPGTREGGRRDAAGRRGNQASATLLSEPLGNIRREVAPRPELTVGFALTKGDRPELTVQKLTELGVDKIVPFLSDRTVVRLNPPDAARRADRLRRVVRAAASQSRRVWLPVVTEPTAFGDLGSLGIAMTLAEPGGGAPGDGMTTILVGPEGGWTKDELARAEGTVSLGGGVLRAETAAIVAGSVLSLLRCGLLVTPTGDKRGVTGG